MCKHKYNFVEPEGMGCEWFNLFSKGFNEPNLTPAFQNLPLDNQGVCIFHSTDIEWKRENYFFERFIDICFYLNNSSSETEIRFNDVQFVGIKPNDTLDDTGKPYIELSNLIINKDILVYDSTFHDTINIERCIFKKGISIETSVFKNGVTLSNNTFKGDFEIYGNCTFEDTLRFLFFNTFYGKLDLMNVNFENNFDLDDVVFFVFRSGLPAFVRIHSSAKTWVRIRKSIPTK